MTSPSPDTGLVERRAREVVANFYRRGGNDSMADDVLSDDWRKGASPAETDLVAAIAEALTAQQQEPVGEVERFNPILDTEDGGYGFLTMEASERGQWVRLSDHQRAIAERDAKRKELLDRCWRLNTRAETAEARISTLEALLVEARETIGWVWRWTWYKEGNGTSDAERLSAIKHHPGIAALNQDETGGAGC